MAKKTTSTADKKKEQQERLNQGGQNIAAIAQNVVARRQELAVNKPGQQYGIRRVAGDMMATRALNTIQDREMLSYRKLLEEEERRRREAEAERKRNAALNIQSVARGVNRGGMTGNPVMERLQKSSLEQILDGLGAKIGNEQKIINQQGRTEDDPARIRAEKELKDLQKRRTDTQAKLDELPQAATGLPTGASFSTNGYTPEEEAYIRRLQGKLEKGQNRKQAIPAVWNPELKMIQHMRNTPEKAEGDEYIRWLREGGEIGLTDKQTTNALIAQAGKSDDPLAQYMALDDSQKSGWLRNAGKDLNSIISMRAAKEYNRAHPYTTDRDALMEQQNYFSGLRDEAQKALDRMNGNIRIMYRPDDGDEYEIRGRSNPYYQQDPETINMIFYNSLVGEGEYQKRKATFTDDPEGWEKADELELQLTEAWDAYEQGRWNDAYRILTGKNNYEEMERQLGYANDQLADIGNKLNLYDQYDEFMGGYTGAQRASYDPEKDRGFDSLVDYGTPNMPRTRPVARDTNTTDVHRIYSFINQGKEYKAYTGKLGDNIKIDAVYGKSALMLPEEIEIFNGYYNAGQYKEASAFFSGLSMALNDRYAKYEEIENREMARKYPVLSSFETLVAEQTSGALALPRTFAGFAGEKNVYDPNSAWYASTRYTQQTQDEIANMIGGEGGKFYLQGMNSLRNLTNAAMVALAGVPASGQAAAGLAMFAAQIYQDQTYKYLKETNDYGKAVGLATLDATLETMEEMLPYEVMLQGGGNIFLSWLANATSEAMEELTGATVGDAIRGLITGRQDWEKRRDQIFNEGGYTDDSGNWISIDTSDSNKALAEAQTQAWKEKGHEIIENTVAGFVGGGLGAGYGQVRGALNTRSTGIQVNSREGGFNTLLEAARGMNEDSATRKLAEQLYEKMNKGKEISNYQAGKLAQTMYQESGQEIRDIIEGAMTRKVETELVEEGASDEYAASAAPIIAEAVTTGKTMRTADVRIIAKENAGVVLMESYMKGDKDARESIKKAGGEAAMNAQQAVRDVLSEGKGPRNGATDALRKFAPVAKAEDVEAAEGPRHDNGLDAVVDGHIVSIQGRNGDNYIVVDENNNERTVNKNDVRAADERLGLLMEYADRNRNIIDDDTFREMAVGLKDNPDMNMDDYIRESTRAYINYRVGAEVKNSRLAASTLNMLKAHAQRMGAKWDEERIKTGRQQKVTPGKGTVTYNGVQYGTNEWLAMAKKLGTQKARELRLIGEIGVRLGNRFEIVEREDLPDAFGWEDEEGTITINLAAESSKGSGRNRSVLTVAAHELTHWLQQNSPEQYRELAQFVFDGLRQQKVNIAGRVIQRMESFQAAMDRQMNIDDALAEIVADACDQVLTNEQTIRQLEEENKGLYNKIKAFVKNFVDTVMKYTRNEKGEVITDSSYESRKIRELGQEFADELARKWLGARAEALEQQKAKPAETKENAGKVSMSTREMDQEYMDAVNSGDMEKAQRMVDQVAEAAGYTIRGDHGTVSKYFTIFDRKYGNAEGDWGKGFYFTNNQDDVETNYASEEGADLTQKIELLAEQMEWMDEYADMDEDERREAAKQQLAGGEPRIIHGALRMTNPVNVGGPEETFFDYNEEYDEENDEYGEPEGSLIDFIEALNDVLSEYEYANVDTSSLYTEGMDYGGLRASDLEKMAKELVQDVEDDDGKLAGHEIVREAFERAGFDGIVDNTVAQKFGSRSGRRNAMVGVDTGTTHYIAFQPEQIKQTDPVTYDDAGNIIPLSERFNPEKRDIRYSTRDLDNQYTQAVKSGDRETAQLMVDAQAIKSGFTTEDAYHGTAAFGFTRFDMDASAGAVFVAFSPKVAGTYVDNGDVRMIGKRYPLIGLDIMNAEQLAKELQEYYRNLPKSFGYETANEWTVKGIDKDDYVDFVLNYAEDMKKLAAGKVFEKELTRLVDKLVALAHTGDEKAAYQAGVDLQRRFRMADFFGQDDLDNRRIELSAMMIPALAKGEDVININRSGMNYYLSRSDVIRQLEKYNQDQEGIYRFYTRPGNQLLIDAKGANWNKIWIEDEQLRNDMWAYFNPTEAYEEARGINTYSKDMFTVTTRELSEYARYRNYSSVRINDVYDHGGRGDWDRERGHGDIAMFFDEQDVKSADPVTYDEDGDVIPLSKRFDRNVYDLRFSTREPDMEVNHWMMGLTESSLRTTQERMLWNAYKESRGSLEVAKKAVREIRAEMEAIEKKENPTAYEKHQLGELNKRLNEWSRKRDMYEEDIIRVTTDKGYAALMYRERNKMENLVNGRTEDEVRAAIDAIQVEMDTVEKEMAERNAKLKELAERETVKSIRNRLNSAGLRRIAAKLKADLGSELQNKEIENRLALLALKMKQGKVDSSEIMELADMLVGTMRPAYDDYVLSELRGMTIALNSSELETLKNRGMTVRDLQRELTGTGIRIVANGPNTIDKNWEELTATFPTLDREANPGDMLYGPDADHKGIMDLVEDAIRQQKAMGPDSDQVAAMVLEAASDLVPEILTDEKSMKLIRESMEFIAEINQSTEALDNMENLFNRLRKKNASAKATLGKLENQIVDAIEYNNELAKQNDVSAWKRDRAALIERLKSEHTQKMLEEQTKYREKIARFKKAQELMADNQAARREIHMNVNRIRRLLVNETDSKNVPEHMKSLAREMVEMILRSDQVSDRKITAIKPEDRRDALRMIQAWNDRDGKFTLNDLQQIPDEEVQSVIENALADIEEGVESYTAPAGRDLIENLSNYKKALTQIQDGVEKITNVIEAEQTAVIDGQKRRVDHLANGVVADLDKSKRKGEWIGFGNKALTAAQRSVIYGNTTPVYFMKNLRNRGMNVLWNGFESAENRKGLLAEAARKHMQGLAEKYHYSSWQHDKNIDVILNGVKVPMKLENIMALYATWTREQQMGPEVSQHMAHGGVYIEDERENKGLPHREHKEQRSRRVKAEDIARIEEMLTQEQKDYIRDVVAYLSDDMSKLGNEASMAMYGIRKYNEKYYFPMKVWDGVKSARSDKGISGTQENRIAHQGWSKRRKHLARNALIIGKFTDTAVRHIDEMTNYVTFAPVIEGLNKVLNWQEATLDDENIENKRNLRVMFQQAYGKEALRYLEDWMKDLQGGVTQDQRKTLRDRLISMFKKNAVAGSLSVTLQQPLSYIRAGMMINPKYLAGALSPQYWKGSYQEMMDHSGVAVIKQMGKFDMNFGQSTRDWIAPKTGKSVYEKISDVLTAAPQAADTMTWTRMWSAVKMEQHAEHPDMDIKSEEFMDLVGKRFNEVMRRTQVYDSTLTKSSNMRSQALSMKLITSFMAEPTLSLNVLADAVMNAKQKGGKANLAKAGATYLLSAVMQAAVKGFMGAGRSPDEKKTAAENLLNKFLYNLLSEANPASLIPGYSDLVEVLKNGELKDDALGVLGKLKSVYTTAQNITNPDKSKGPWRDVEDTLGQFVQLFSNIPMKNLMRDARAMYNWATGSKFADRPTSGAVITYQGREMLMNGDNLLGVINSWLGDAGYKTSNKAYYTRMYNAMAGGNQGEAEGIREYLELAKGQDSKKIEAGLRTAAREDDSKTPAETSQWMIDNDLLSSTSTITTQFKEGAITAEEYKELAMAANPELTENDVWWTVDKHTWEQENGEAHSDYYYRLGPALDTNRSAEITETINLLLEHGRTKENIKTQLTKELKPLYMAADSAGKVKIRNELQLAYKALGLTAADADKIIKGWK